MVHCSSCVYIFLNSDHKKNETRNLNVFLITACISQDFLFLANKTS